MNLIKEVATVVLLFLVITFSITSFASNYESSDREIQNEEYFDIVEISELTTKYFGFRYDISAIFIADNEVTGIIKDGELISNSIRDEKILFSTEEDFSLERSRKITDLAYFLDVVGAWNIELQRIIIQEMDYVSMTGIITEEGFFGIKLIGKEKTEILERESSNFLIIPEFTTTSLNIWSNISTIYLVDNVIVGVIKDGEFISTTICDEEFEVELTPECAKKVIIISDIAEIMGAWNIELQRIMIQELASVSVTGIITKEGFFGTKVLN